MRMIDWLNRIHKTLTTRTTRTRRNIAVEKLEQRTLLTVNTLLVGTELTVITDQAENLVVSRDATTDNVSLQANGSAVTSLGAISAANLTALFIFTSDEGETVDLSGISAAGFPALTRIEVETGDGDDTIIGSEIAALLDGHDGNDTIISGAGADTLDGGNGNDSLQAGDGNDQIQGGHGHDTIDAGTGADNILAGHGFDSVLAGDGDDTVDGSDGSDTILGGAGNDSIVSSQGADSVLGGDGNDTVYGGSEADTIDGEAGNDSLLGQGARDLINGGDGDDFVNGGKGNDSLLGGAGQDYLFGDVGNDTAFGEDGNDTIIGGGGADFIKGENDDDVILGNAGNDTLLGGSGNDFVRGGNGNDIMSGNPPLITISNATFVEGNSGFGFLQFTVSLSEAALETVTVDYATANGTATGGTDYTIISPTTLTFAAGATSQIVTVQVFADSVLEIDETVLVNLSNAVNGVIGDSQGVGTIFDDDSSGLARVSFAPVGPAPVNEGNSGTTTIQFVVLLLDPQSVPVSVDFSTADITATAGSDYNASAGTLTFSIDPLTGFTVTQQVIDVTIVGDVFVGMNETFVVNLSNPSANAVVVDSQEVGVIVSDEPGQVQINVAPAAATEAANAQAVFQVTLSAPSEIDIPITYSTQDGTAVAGADYVAVTNQVLTIPSGQTTGQIAINLIDDTTAEGAETFSVVISTTIPGATVISGQAQATIAANDSGSGGGGGGGGGGVIIIFFAHEGQVDGAPASLHPGSAGDGEFDIEWRFAPELTQNQVESLTSAGDRWTQIITGDIPGFTVPGYGLVDDLLVEVKVVDMDGAGGELGAATTLAVRPDSNLPAVAQIQLDRADLSRLEASGRLRELALHELAHALGFGPSWAGLGLVSSDRKFTGSRATQEYNQLFGLNADGVPLSADGGHWREDEFGRELMTGLLDSPVAISRVTIAQFADLGYVVDLSQADRFSPSANASVATKTLSAFEVNQGDTLDGENGNDTVRGGFGKDLLLGGPGNDQLFGFGEDDILLGGGGNDILDGGLGDDILTGNGGQDTVLGGGGTDTYRWNGTGDGKDTAADTTGTGILEVRGSSGSDVYTVGTSGSLLQITQGSARFTVNTSITEVNLLPGAGADTVTITDLSASSPLGLVVNGQDGNDTITAAGARLGNVTLQVLGGNGNDTLTGSRDRDFMDGEAGNDVLNGGDGDDSLSGGDGLDTIGGGSGNDTIAGGIGNDSLTGGTGNDSITGSFGDDFVDGEEGHDTISGGFGNDSLVGSFGDDLVRGDQGDDILLGGTGNDRLSGGDGNDFLRGHAGHDQIKGGDGNDTIQGDNGDDTVDAGDGNDQVFTGDGVNIVNGGDGNDFLQGGADSDTLLGEDGNDIIIGGAGVDRIHGEDGDDTLTGNGGTDRFNSGLGADTITDLGAAEVDDLSLDIPASVLTALAKLSQF